MALLISAVAAIIAGGITLTNLPADFFLRSRIGATDSIARNRQAVTIDSLKAKVDSIRVHTDRLQAILRDTSRTPSEVALLRDRQVQLERQVAKVEQVILADPAKALDMVLIRKEIDAFKEQTSTKAFAIEHDIERVYDMNKLIIGLMFTMSLGILSLAAVSLFRDRKRAAPPE